MVAATEYWQQQGFPDYQDTAWHRKTFDAPATNDDAPRGVNQQNMLLFFGGVGGNAVVYLNGKKMGKHRLGKNFQGWDDPFGIDVIKAIKTGKNLIALQVTKDKLAGGMFRGVSLQSEAK